jgi:hypothetical protein
VVEDELGHVFSRDALPFGMRSIPRMYLPLAAASVNVEGRTMTQSADIRRRWVSGAYSFISANILLSL